MRRIAWSVAVGVALALAGTAALAGRNVAGTYSNVSGPYVSGTVISSSSVNNQFNDYASALTGSLSRDGFGGMRAPLALTDGSAAAPSLTFNNDATAGWFRPGANRAALSLGGVQRLEQNASGLIETGWAQFAGTVTVGGTLTASGEIAAPNAWHGVRTTSDFSTTSGSFTAVTGLSFAVSANGEYEWEASLWFARAGAGTDLYLNIAGPASPTLVRLGANGNTGLSGPVSLVGTYGTSAWPISGVVLDTGAYSSTPFVTTARGYIVNGANSGTAQLKIRSSDGATSCTIYRGSLIRWRRLDAVE